MSTEHRVAFEVKFVLYFDKWLEDVTSQGMVHGVKGFIEKSCCMTPSEFQELRNRIDDVANLDHFKSGSMHSLYSAARRNGRKRVRRLRRRSGAALTA